MKLRGLVLAGGASSRFGSDKALAFLEGRRLVEHAVILLKEAGLDAVVSARRGLDYAFLDCPVIPDKFPGLGPLGGLWTAFSTFKGVSFLVLTCDMPLLTHAALLSLIQNRQPSYKGTFYSVGSEPQPFPGIYEVSFLGDVKARILENRLSMRGLIADGNTRLVPWQADASVFLNVNSRQDFPASPSAHT